MLTVSSCILSCNDYHKILDIYRKKKLQFPVISSVLSKLQPGKVFISSDESLAFIVHKFGFAQIIELAPFHEKVEEFIYHIFEHKMQIGKKIRIYDLSEKWMNLFIQCVGNKIECFDRVQLGLSLTKKISLRNKSERCRFAPITSSNIQDLNHQLGEDFLYRFWKDSEALIRYSLGSLAYIEDQIVGICYGCAREDKKIEIDVYTLDPYKGKGIGQQNVLHFLAQCSKNQLIPNWDCYANNTPSLSLAKKVGFEIENYYTHAIL